MALAGGSQCYQAALVQEAERRLLAGRDLPHAYSNDPQSITHRKNQTSSLWSLPYNYWIFPTETDPCNTNSRP